MCLPPKLFFQTARNYNTRGSEAQASHPRKNLDRLLKEFRILKDIARIPHKRAAVGPPGWLNGSVHQTVSDLQLSLDVILTGFVDDDTLNRLYNNARLLVYPSLYEGIVGCFSYESRSRRQEQTYISVP